jgi:sialate O-acetylesterase
MPNTRPIARRARPAGVAALLLAPAAGAAQPTPAPSPPPAPADAPRLRLSRLVGDGMVMQRGAAVPVWGTARPGAPVVVTFDGRRRAAAPDAAGRWEVRLPAMPAGGPHAMTVAQGPDTVAVRDILVGDVWVCSGQSNMEWTVADARNGAAEARAARDSGVRHFRVPQSWSWTPEDTLPGGPWQPAESAHAGGFTAVGYFFARALRRASDVPIGLLHTSWGGSRIEAWMRPAALGLGPDATARLRAADSGRVQAVRDTLRARLGDTLPTADAGLVAGRAVWADPALDDSAWAPIAVPAAWEGAGYPALDGVAWYRTAFTLTEAEARAGVRLGLGRVDDSDVAWVNGREVGRMQGAWNRARVYDVPAAALVPGRNVIAVRVEDTGGGGGVTGTADELWVEAGGARRPLAGRWRFRVGEARLGDDRQGKTQVPTVLWNAMVDPATRYPVKGVIWYQGESNANTPADAAAYAGQFRRMIADWRARWNAPAMPFLWVQLANFMAADTLPPAASAWALLRESQHAALALPHTGEALAVDAGEADDIHPRDKQTVGERLARAARAVAYGAPAEWRGPAYAGHEARGARVLVRFAHAAGLAAGRRPDGRAAADSLGGFAVAGADRRWHWARARVTGAAVEVWSDRVPRPVAVRYAWGNNPERANLYNAAGLPAAPFRTDRW